MIFKGISNLFGKSSSEDLSEKKELPSVEKTIAQIEEREELLDNYQLVAVITAALAASLDKNVEDFVVRSIKRAKTSTWKNI